MTETATLADRAPAPGTGRSIGAAISRTHRSLRTARRMRAETERELDACRAERTIPRGRGRRDADHAPGVDPDVWRLHVHYHRTGDERALAALVAEYDGYARSIALRLHRDHEALDDLEQVAREGLIKAIRRFDPERGLPFPAFATPTIMGAIRRHYRDRGWAIRVPRKVHEITVASRAAEDRLVRRLGRTPTTDELAEELGITLDELLEVQDAVIVRNAASLDELTAASAAALHGAATAPSQTALVDDRLALRRALAKLDEQERTIVGLYFFEGMSQSQIAARYAVSQMQVSRWLSGILRRMRVWIPA